MSDIMRPMSYEHLLDWVLEEYKEKKSIFGVSKMPKHPAGDDSEDRSAAGRKAAALPIFKEKIESPFGPAAGPNTQLAQNIVASYVAGARFFELKTVQQMDGAELAACVAKPCITAADECYNCEWSTELTVPQAYAEYVKAWFLCRILARELSLGDPGAFVFNMSVGYDLEGIKTPKIDAFIEGMKDAAETEVFKHAREVSLKAVEEGRLKKVDRAFVEAIPARVSDSITESTLHGCPPDEIERIASYLITEKGLNTFIKCNPTILGYDFARSCLDDLGFDYIAFDDHHFKEDLQWEDAVPMFRRLMALCKEKGLEFGLKLTNTFPVDVKAGELPSEEMYMSGRSLYPLTMEVASRVSREFDGKLRISFSGGADFFNIRKIFDAGIWPITMATTVLKPGGYQRFAQIAGLFMDLEAKAWDGIDVEGVKSLAEEAAKSPRNTKQIKPLPDRKNGRKLPMLSCFTAPCQGGCPISQDIPAYLRAVNEGRMEDALRIILERNALPFTTGTLCPHTCGDKCMRNYYEETVHIREAKLLAAEEGYSKVLEEMKTGGRGDKSGKSGKNVAVIGGGPAGLAAAAFLSRAGVPVTVFERKEKPGGVPRYVIPGFRISQEALDKDVELCKAYGAEFVTGREITSVEELKEEGYTHVIIAVGAWLPGRGSLQYGEALDALEFLEQAKAEPEALNLGADVAVIGGGNTAMDTARAAKRIPGVENVRLIYRRTRRYMPAEEEELAMALEDGIEFRELLAPIGLEDGKLKCEICKLGQPDASGRRSPEATGQYEYIPASAVITAVGAQVSSDLCRKAGAELDSKGLPLVDQNLCTTVPGLYAAGDCRRGPATVVKAIADAQKAAAAIAGLTYDRYEEENRGAAEEACLAKKGDLTLIKSALPDRRCLGCPVVCEVCADVCPNRANVVIKVPGLAQAQILHVDGMCNECGNCATFCPWSGRPYRDKFTLFWSREDFEHSNNSGFLPLEDGQILVRLEGYTVRMEDGRIPEEIVSFILTVMKDYSWLLPV